MFTNLEIIVSTSWSKFATVCLLKMKVRIFSAELIEDHSMIHNLYFHIPSGHYQTMIACSSIIPSHPTTWLTTTN